MICMFICLLWSSTHHHINSSYCLNLKLIIFWDKSSERHIIWENKYMLYCYWIWYMELLKLTLYTSNLSIRESKQEKTAFIVDTSSIASWTVEELKPTSSQNIIVTESKVWKIKSNNIRYKMEFSIRCEIF